MTTNNAKFSWEEIEKHSSLTDRWIVIEGKVYDVTKWQNRHPGGRKIIGHYATQDATVRHLFRIITSVRQEAFLAFHKDLETTKKFLKPYCVGEVDTSDLDPKRESFLARRRKFAEDFEALRRKMHEMVSLFAVFFRFAFENENLK